MLAVGAGGLYGHFALPPSGRRLVGWLVVLGLTAL